MSTDKQLIKAGLVSLADLVYDAQTKLGQWDLVDEEDLGGSFADVFAKLGRAYDGYQEGADPSDITWIDEVTGAEAEPGKGIPQGLAADIADVIFDLLGLARRLGIDVSVFADVAEAHAKFATDEVAAQTQVEGGENTNE